MNKFLINKTSALGDIVQSYPVLSYLKKKYPNCQIDWICEKGCESLVQNHPYVHECISINTKKWRKKTFYSEFRKEFAFCKTRLQSIEYDVLFDLQGNCKSALFTFLASAKEKVGFGYKSVAEWPNLLVTKNRWDPPPSIPIREKYLSLVQNYFQDPVTFLKDFPLLQINEKEKKQLDDFWNTIPYPNLPTWVIAPGSAWINKKLPIQTLGKILSQQNFNGNLLFLWGSEKEKKEALFLCNLFPKKGLLIPLLSLSVLQNLFAKVDLVVGMDSLPLHLAASSGTPTFSFFGPSLASIYKPVGNQHQFFQGACPYEIPFETRCPKLRSCPTGACLRSPTSQEHLRIALESN